MPKTGICSECGKNRSLRYSHPETKKPICTVCYLKATGKFGFCANCGKRERPIPYYDHETKKNICHNCHNKIKRREKGLPLRENRYPDSKAVLEALAAREKEGKENFPRVLQLEDYRLYRRACEIGIYLPRRHRKNPFPTREAVIEALKTRTAEGKRNNAETLLSEDAILYRRALKFGVALPKGRSVAVNKTEKSAALPEAPAPLVAAETIEPQLIISTTKEEPKKHGRIPKYPTPESVIEVLRIRRAEGKSNYARVLKVEDQYLYKKAREFGVALPRHRFIKKSQREKPGMLRSTPPVTPLAVVENRFIEKSEESPKKSSREPKYSSRETTIVALEARKAQGKENFPDVLMREDILLCCAARRFRIELPAREGPSVIYREGDLVEDKIDPALAGRIGKVLGASERGVAVNFGEKGRIRRIYEKGFNISNIVLYSGALLTSPEPIQEEAMSVEKEGNLDEPPE